MTELSENYIRRLSEEGGGVMNLAIVSALALGGGVARGDPRSIGLLHAILYTGRWIKRAPRNRPVLCICCPQPVRQISPATAFGVVSPATPRPTDALAFAFCTACGGHPDGDLMEKARAGLRRIWPELRPITVTHEAGHA